MIFTFRVFTGALFFVGVAFLLRVVRFLTLVAFVRRHCNQKKNKRYQMSNKYQVTFREVIFIYDLVNSDKIILGERSSTFKVAEYIEYLMISSWFYWLVS